MLAEDFNGVDYQTLEKTAQQAKLSVDYRNSYTLKTYLLRNNDTADRIYEIGKFKDSFSVFIIFIKMNV